MRRFLISILLLFVFASVGLGAEKQTTPTTYKLTLPTLLATSKDDYMKAIGFNLAGYRDELNQMIASGTAAWRQPGTVLVVIKDESPICIVRVEDTTLDLYVGRAVLVENSDERHLAAGKFEKEAKTLTSGDSGATTRKWQQSDESYTAGPKPKSPPSSSGSSRARRVMTKATLFSNGRVNFEKLAKIAAAGDEAEIRRWIANGKAFLVQPGTLVTPEKTEFGVIRIKAEGYYTELFTFETIFMQNSSPR